MTAYYNEWMNKARQLDLNAETIIIEDSVRTLETFAFQKCERVKRIVIGKGVQKIDNGAFSRCPTLTEIEVDPANECFYVSDKSLIERRNKKLHLCFGEPRITDEAEEVDLSSAFTFRGVCDSFYIGRSLKKFTRAGNCFQISSVELNPENEHFELRCGCLYEKGGKRLILGCANGVIDESAQVIAREAFAYSNIAKIIIPSTVRTIERDAFYCCRALKEVVFSEGVKSIGFRAFSACRQLREIALPDSLKELGEQAFESCESLKKIPSFGGVKKISDSAFTFCRALKEAVIPGSVETVERCAFYSCGALESVRVEYGTKRIGNGAFERCENLRSVTLADSVEELGSDCFSSCKKLEAVRLSEQLKTIPMRAFARCDSLKEITLPSSVKKLEAIAFEDCVSLERINTEHVIKYYRDTFSGCKKLPKEVKTPPKKTADKSALPEDMFSYYDFDDIVFNCEPGDEVLLLNKTESVKRKTVLKGAFDYEGDSYLAVSFKGEAYFVELDEERDDENNLFPAMVIGKSHALFNELGEAFQAVKDEYPHTEDYSE